MDTPDQVRLNNWPSDGLKLPRPPFWCGAAAEMRIKRDDDFKLGKDLQARGDSLVIVRWLVPQSSRYITSLLDKTVNSEALNCYRALLINNGKLVVISGDFNALILKTFGACFRLYKTGKWEPQAQTVISGWTERGCKGSGWEDGSSIC